MQHPIYLTRQRRSIFPFVSSAYRRNLIRLSGLHGGLYHGSFIQGSINCTFFLWRQGFILQSSQF
jgi:hypothetical protein